MIAIDRVLMELLESLPHEHELLRMTRVDLDLPFEARMGARAELEMSAPRGRLATGFDAPLARVSARFERSGE